LHESALPRGARTTRPGALRAACAAAWATRFWSAGEFMAALPKEWFDKVA
jgi:hypothetical protein